MRMPADWRRLPALCVCLCALLAAAGGGLARAQDDDLDDLVHTVEVNQTLTSIAGLYGVSLAQLISLNNLANPDILSVGKQLLVIPAAQRPAWEAAKATAEPTVEAERALGGGRSAEELAAAPVTPADAPKIDPANHQSALCLSIYADANDNGLPEPVEAYLAGATIWLLDPSGGEVWRFSSELDTQPHCQRDLAPGSYALQASAPPGYGLTTPAHLQIELMAGARLALDIGAKQGRQTVAIPTLIAPPNPTAEPAPEADGSVLYGLSGLLALGLAGVVLASGMALALFVRAR